MERTCEFLSLFAEEQLPSRWSPTSFEAFTGKNKTETGVKTTFMN